MNWEEIDEWMRERLEDGEYATVRDFLEAAFSRSGEYDEYRESAEAKMRDYESERDGLNSEIERLKVRNYDLLENGAPVADEIDGDGVVEDIVEDDGEVYHIDNLFVDDDEKEGE